VTKNNLYVIGVEDRAFRHPVYLKDTGELIGFIETPERPGFTTWSAYLATGGKRTIHNTAEHAADSVVARYLEGMMK
jgi:hypothetical protein